jgi:integrase/recombinase XerD
MSISSYNDVESALAGFSSYLFCKHGAGSTTVDNQVSTIRRAVRKIGMDPTEDQVQSYVANLARRGSSYSHIVNTSIALEHYMKFLGRPIKLARPRKPRMLVKGVLSVPEVTALIAAAKNLREKAILVTLAYTGIRNKELCNLKISDLDLERKTLCVRGVKTSVSRMLRLPDACAAVLEEYLKERNGSFNDFLFVTHRRGDYYEPQDLRKTIRQRAKDAGIRKRVYPHLLRHSLATNLLRSGTGLLAVKQQLGHTDVTATMRYVHSDPERLEEEFLVRVPKYLPE